MTQSNLPKISIIILTINEESFLRKCLASIRNQSYPQGKIEIVVVDNGSKDRSVEVAKSFGAKVSVNSSGDVFQNWAIAMKKITGDFTYMVDQDIELREPHFFQQMLKPLLEDKKIVASFTRKYVRKDQPWITRYLSHHPSQQDPLYEFLIPPVTDYYIKEKPDYIICKFKLGRVPPFGRMFFRVKHLRNIGIMKLDRIFDYDLIERSIRSGQELFAYVPKAGLYHHHAKSFRHLLKKRIRNVHLHYLPYKNSTDFLWIDVRRREDVFKMIYWILYANLIAPATLRGFIRFLRIKDPVVLMEPVVALVITDVLLLEFIKTGSGRNMYVDSLKTLLK